MQYFVPVSWNADQGIYAGIIAGLLAVIGHTLPVFAAFKGGKGVATLLGMGIALYGGAVWISVIAFVLIISITRYVSLGSLTAGFIFPFVVIFYFRISNPGLMALSVFAALFIIWTHRKNIVRLVKGEENRFGFRRLKDKS